MRKNIIPLLFGLIGAAILAALGVWQLQRLAWKQDVIAQIEARLANPAASVPVAPNEADDEYRPVLLEGQFGAEELHVLTSIKGQGPGFRVIRAFESGGRRLLVDIGFIENAQKQAARPLGAARIAGNLLWPDEQDGFTPDPDLNKNYWFARDLGPMADALGTDPVLVVAAQAEPPLPSQPLPVTVNIPNDHMHYAITWFSLMVIWIGMTLYWLWRNGDRQNRETD